MIFHFRRTCYRIHRLCGSVASLYNQEARPVIPLEKDLYASKARLTEELKILIDSQRFENAPDAVRFLDNLLGCKPLASLEVPVKFGPDILKRRMFGAYFFHEQKCAAFNQALFDLREELATVCKRQKL